MKMKIKELFSLLSDRDETSIDTNCFEINHPNIDISKPYNLDLNEQCARTYSYLWYSLRISI